MVRRASLFLIVFFVVFLLGARVLPVLFPPPPSTLPAVFVDPFGVPCSTSCLFGVHPGELCDVAVVLLQRHPLTSHLDLSRESDSAEFYGPDVAVKVIADKDGLVETIYAYLSPNEDIVSANNLTTYHLSLGSILSTFGEPTRVDIATFDPDQRYGTISWYYAGNTMLIQSTVNSVDFDSSIPLRFIGLSAHPASLEKINPVNYNQLLFTRFSVPAWHGYDTFQSYFAAPGCTVESGLYYTSRRRSCASYLRP